MNYNIAIIVAAVTTMLVALGISTLAVDYFLADSSWKKMAQLIMAVFLMTTFYAPIKHILLKYMDIKGNEDE